MPELTRRRSLDAPDECWHVYYGDVRVGSRTGMPPGEDLWSWACGFYPGSHPGECADGTAATFDQARAHFEEAWAVFLANRTEADFQAWRDERDWTERKYAMWQRGSRMPSQKPSSLMTCRCGVDAAVKKLLEIANGLEPDHAGRIHIGAINAIFMTAGGNPPEYSAAVKAAIDRGYMTMHPSGGYLSFTQAGADLFA